MGRVGVNQLSWHSWTGYWVRVVCE